MKPMRSPATTMGAATEATLSSLEEVVALQTLVAHEVEWRRAAWL